MISEEYESALSNLSELVQATDDKDKGFIYVLLTAAHDTLGEEKKLIIKEGLKHNPKSCKLLLTVPQ